MGKQRTTKGSKFFRLWPCSAAADAVKKVPHSRTLARKLALESLEDRLVLSTVLPFSQLGVTSSGNFPGGEATDAFDGTGLISADLHNNLWNEGWLSNGGTPVGEWLKVDLGGTYDIDYLRVWNDNQASLTSRGIKQADIYVAFSDPGDNLDSSSQPFDPTDWTLAVADQHFTKSPGGASIVNTDPQISLGGVQAAFLAIRIDSSWGDPEFVGLSEMQIYVDDSNVTTFPLVVNDGSGDGAYAPGANVAVAADSAPLGQVFDAWAGDTSFLADVLDPTTTLTMPGAAATISATYRNLPSGDSETWQIDFEATEPTHPSLFSITSTWDAGFGSTWNTYTNPMRNGATVPPQSGHTETNLLDATGSATAVDFSLVSGTTLGMIAGYAGAGIENTIYSVAREHLFWGGDTNTSDAIGFEFSDLDAGTYDLTFITNAQWHIPHRGFNATVGGQSIDFHPEAGGNEVILNGILSYKEANLDVTLHNITVDTSGILTGTLTELEAFSDPSLAGIILTQTSAAPAPDPDADFDEDGDVDGSDFLSWQRGFGVDAGSGNVAPLASGNANGNQRVDADDLTIWQDQFGQVTSINSGPANLALGKPVTVSGNVTSTDVGTHTVDGVEDTLWRTPVGNPWIVVDLGEVYDDIDRVSMRYSRSTGYYATNFDIEYSLDNVQWSLAKNESNGFHSTKVDILFDPVSARYIRYSINTLSHPTQGVRLDEIQVFQTRPLHELNRRDDAGNFFNKLAAGGEVKVAYIGGSVTVQPDGWTEQSQAMIEQMYPGVQVTPFESAVGGTGTQAALGRVASVIASNPDLVFIEFAINDSHQPYENNLANMEQLVRQIWTADPTVDIVFVYTLRESAQIDLKDVDTLASGYYQTMSAAAFEEVADYYGIPTIHMGKVIAEQAALGQIIMEGPTTSQNGIPVFASDGIHPFIETGHVWYTEALQRSFAILGTNTNLLTHSLPATEIREVGGSAIVASSADDSGSLLSGLTLESQQQSATDKAIVLFVASHEEFASSGNVLTEPLNLNAFDDAFLRLEQQADETEETEEKEDLDTPLISGGLIE